MKSPSMDISPYSRINFTSAHEYQQLRAPDRRMDLNTLLNPSDDLDSKAEQMGIDIYPTPPLSHRGFSRESSATTEDAKDISPCSRVNAKPLPPMQCSWNTPDGKEERSYVSILPPVRMLAQNIHAPTPGKNAIVDYCKALEMLELQRRATLNLRPHHVQLHRRTESIVHTLDKDQPLRVENDTCAFHGRRRSDQFSNPHHSLHSPRTPPYRISRGSHPQLVSSFPFRHASTDYDRNRGAAIVAESKKTRTDGTCRTRTDNNKAISHSSSLTIYLFIPTSIPKPKKKSQKKTPHNNKPYTVEQIDWIRYHRIDKPDHFQVDLQLFWEQFPERYDPETTGQALSARLYRDNDRPELDGQNRWCVGARGKIKLVQCKVRDWPTEHGKALDFPTSLVDKWPARLLCERYKRWKSPISKEDRERAKQILAGNDVNDRFGQRAFWRRILCECEHLLYRAGELEALKVNPDAAQKEKEKCARDVQLV